MCLRTPFCIQASSVQYVLPSLPTSKFISTIECLGMRTELYTVKCNATEPGFFKLSRSPRIDSKEPIPPGCVAWRASTTTLFLLGS